MGNSSWIDAFSNNINTNNLPDNTKPNLPKLTTRQKLVKEFSLIRIKRKL